MIHDRTRGYRLTVRVLTLRSSGACGRRRGGLARDGKGSERRVLAQLRSGDVLLVTTRLDRKRRFDRTFNFCRVVAMI